MRFMTIMFSILAATAACGKESPDKQCEKIYEKGDGEKAYSTDKAKFIEACVKTGDNTRKCLLMKGKDRMKDDSCGPAGGGNTFDEMAALMKLGQGTP